MTPEQILEILVSQKPVRTRDLPKDARGIYGLIDHTGTLSYIGSTSQLTESFYRRIHQRHRSGSESHSHYFSKIYNCGRMYRDRMERPGTTDAKLAKALRNSFIAEYCRAVFVTLDGDKSTIEALEAQVIHLARRRMALWNGQMSIVYDEPTELVNELLKALNYSAEHLAALERQALSASAGK